MTLKQFSIRFLIWIFISLALIGLFNRIVDPFWYYRDIEINGFNEIKTQFGKYERHVKPALLERENPEAIILGSSFSEIGFDPRNLSFTNQGILKSMNFALAGAPWGMVQCEFEFAASHASIKRALVGFNSGDLPLVDCAKDYPSIGQISAVQLLLSNSALEASIDTVRYQNDMPSHTREGMYLIQSRAPDYEFRESLLQRLREYHCEHHILKQPDNNENYQDQIQHLKMRQHFDLSGLQRMIKTAHDHGIELILFAYPSHAYLLELERQCGASDAGWQALKQITQLINAESDKGGNLRGYQFFGYNQIMAEPINNEQAKYWHDPGHFKSEMGNIMLADMFSSNRCILGKRLELSNFNDNYREFLQSRSNYLHQHPGFLSELGKLLPQP